MSRRPNVVVLLDDRGGTVARVDIELDGCV